MSLPRQVVVVIPLSAMSPPKNDDREIVVSVIIPAFNAALWLEIAVGAACCQSLRQIEILVVDDGSTDGTVELVRRLAAGDSRIRLVERGNGGVGAARNSGIRAARGKYIAPLDADDVWHPSKLERQVERMESGGEETGLVYCWSEKIDDTGRVITHAFRSDLEGWVPRSLVLRNFIGNASVPLFRASALRAVGLYLERSEQAGAQGCEDWDLAIRIAERFKVGLVPETLVSYRQVDDCMSLNVRSMATSYRTMINRVRARNPELESAVLRWSAGNFHSYLVSKCFLWGDYRGCLSSMVSAVSADPVLLVNRRFYLMGLKSVIRLLTGTRSRAPWSKTSGAGQTAPSPSKVGSPRRVSWTDSIKRRRMQLLVEEDCLHGEP